MRIRNSEFEIQDFKLKAGDLPPYERVLQIALSLLSPKLGEHHRHCYSTGVNKGWVSLKFEIKSRRFTPYERVLQIEPA